MSSICYGIPGRMIEIMPETEIKQYHDPAPSILKQLVKRNDETKTMTIEYDSNNPSSSQPKIILQLPQFSSASTYTNYLFYCHSPDALSCIYNDNYDFFLKNAWPEIRDDDNFFVCILHNVVKNFGFRWLSSNTIEIRRPNEGLDFGAYADGLHFTGLDKLNVKMQSNLCHVFFMNDTVYGPIYPWWMEHVKWTHVLKKMLVNDVKLAGMTINPMQKDPHVQSMLLITDHIGLDIAMRAKVFARRPTKPLVIQNSELGFSAAILRAGFNIDCLAELLHGKDYRHAENIPHREFGDVISVGGYAGHSIHPFETIFSKTNRMNRELCMKMQIAKSKLEQKKEEETELNK